MSSLRKYVVSRTLTKTPWGPATILNGEVVDQIAEIKRQAPGELQVHGSGRLARTLLTEGLVDKIRLVITPTVVGEGRRLFPDVGPALGMRLTETRTTPGGLTILVLEATGTATFATYQGVAAIDRGGTSHQRPGEQPHA